MESASSSVIPLSNVDSLSQHLQQSWEHQEELYQGTRYGAAQAKPTCGAQRKELVVCNKVPDCRHINLAVFLPTPKIDCLISLVSIELQKGQAKHLAKKTDLTWVQCE